MGASIANETSESEGDYEDSKELDLNRNQTPHSAAGNTPQNNLNDGIVVNDTPSSSKHSQKKLTIERKRSHRATRNLNPDYGGKKKPTAVRKLDTGPDGEA